jgi:hypothetical protein
MSSPPNLSAHRRQGLEPGDFKMIKFTVTTVAGTVSLAMATLLAAPANAVDPGANPTGNWVCLAAGAIEPIGLLTMTEAAYAFARTGERFSSLGQYRIDRNVITVTSGPLKDDFGLGRGYFNTAASPLALTFDATAGPGMTCNPDVDM